MRGGDRVCAPWLRGDCRHVVAAVGHLGQVRQLGGPGAIDAGRDRVRAAAQRDGDFAARVGDAGYRHGTLGLGGVDDVIAGNRADEGGGQRSQRALQRHVLGGNGAVVAGLVLQHHVEGRVGAVTLAGHGQIAFLEFHLPAAVGAHRGGLRLAATDGDRHLGAGFARAAQAYAVLGFGAGDGGVVAFQLQVGSRCGRCLVQRELGLAGGGVALGVGGGDRQHMLAVGKPCRQRHARFPLAVGISLDLGQRVLLVGQPQRNLAVGCGRTHHLHRGSRFLGVDVAVFADGADDGGGAGGVHDDLAGHFRRAVAGGINGGRTQRVGAIGSGKVIGLQRGAPVAVGVHGRQAGYRTQLEFYRTVGLGRTTDGNTCGLFRGSDDVVTGHGRHFGAGRRRVVEVQRGQRQGALHALVGAHHFQAVGVRQAGGGQRAAAGRGGLQVHRPVAVLVGLGGVGDVGVLVAIGVNAHLHFGAGFGRAVQYGEARVEVGGGFERERDVALGRLAIAAPAASTTGCGQTQHGCTAQAVQQRLGGHVTQHGQDGGLELGVIQHEGAVIQRAQWLGVHVGQQHGAPGTFRRIRNAHGLVATGRHGTLVRGAADAVVAFQNHRGGAGIAVQRHVLDHQIAVHLQYPQLFGVQVGIL